MKTLIKQTVGYGAASACALLIDITILWTLVHYLDVKYLMAATISFMTGTLVAYELSLRFAFSHHRLRNPRAELIFFICIGAGGLAINAAVIFVAVEFFGLHYVLAKCVASGFTFTCNFVARRELLFVPPSTI